MGSGEIIQYAVTYRDLQSVAQTASYRNLKTGLWVESLVTQEDRESKRKKMDRGEKKE